MPFKSTSQMGWMFANKPQMAKEWASETPNIKGLPQRVGADKNAVHQNLVNHFIRQGLKPHGK
jgi:hypothetical protein